MAQIIFLDELSSRQMKDVFIINRKDWAKNLWAGLYYQFLYLSSVARVSYPSSPKESGKLGKHTMI